METSRVQASNFNHAVPERLCHVNVVLVLQYKSTRRFDSVNLVDPKMFFKNTFPKRITLAVICVNVQLYVIFKQLCVTMRFHKSTTSIILLQMLPRSARKGAHPLPHPPLRLVDTSATWYFIMKSAPPNL